MKKFITLGLLFLFVTYAIFLGITTWEPAEGEIGEGDEPIHDIPELKLGGTVEDVENDVLSIGQMQTSYIMYVNGDIDFEDMVEENITNLESVLNYPFNPEKGYLFSSGYDDNSKVQIYYQSNQEETRTVILKVVYGEDGNKVTKIYDGTYFKLVAVNDEDPTKLLAYDAEHEVHRIEVE